MLDDNKILIQMVLKLFIDLRNNELIENIKFKNFWKNNFNKKSTIYRLKKFYGTINNSEINLCKYKNLIFENFLDKYKYYDENEIKDKNLQDEKDNNKDKLFEKWKKKNLRRILKYSINFIKQIKLIIKNN